uniref:ribosomal protein S16 n=1 Tax=Limonium otolepis TaxID=1288439 RepID=UPI0021AC8848|nr:ribosomal protein S16 [Limonium otolepis]UUL95491.1 ribosomal protein S16 [Limonium otolepis]
MTIHDSLIESIAHRFQIRGMNVMVKLRLKRCGRKQRATIKSLQLMFGPEEKEEIFGKLVFMIR